MKDLFGLNHIGTYEARRVLRFEAGRLLVDTSWVSDGYQPYETGVQHHAYNDGKMIIVEAYDTESQARSGQARWVKTMTQEPLPRELVDCGNSYIAGLIRALGGQMKYPYESH